MKRMLGTLTLSALCLSLIVGCVKNTPSSTPPHTATNTTHSTQVSSTDTNQFRPIQNQGVRNVDVVCVNCQAHFKLNQQMQKMAMKGNAIVACPICHHNYLKKEGS